MSIYITGDLHGDFKRIFTSDLKRNDTFIILGDVGLITEEKSSIRERLTIRRLSNMGFTIAFISGNHDNEDRLDKYPISEWNGGMVHIIKKRTGNVPAIVHMLRGQIYDIENNRFFAFGGSGIHEKNTIILDKSSKEYLYEKQELTDNNIFFRTKGIDYWERCLASEKEMNEGLTNLQKVDNQVDYVLTHCAPTDIQLEIYGGDISWTDKQTEYLQKVSNIISFKRWYFGHYHCNYTYNNESFQCIYDNIIKL